MPINVTQPTEAQAERFFICYNALCHFENVAVLYTPLDAFEHLFFAVFGMSSVKDVQKAQNQRPPWTEYLFKIMFMVYMSVSVVVLINLLIAMMSDTYQRIQAQSDIEWKYGLAKLIRNMHRTTTTPSPLNLITSWFMYLLQLCRQKGERVSFDVAICLFILA